MQVRSSARTQLRTAVPSGARYSASPLSFRSLPPRPVYLELDTPQYAGKIKDQKILEKLLAMGGVRLAAVLNELFDPSPEGTGRTTSQVMM
ncbi:hypothetical protein FRB99_000595 [Tulasnella sp. 403]|nr:hypothetical protein FRB99_000595 [Tulasnella sp. 403]